jgi:hypothetical protein
LTAEVTERRIRHIAKSDFNAEPELSDAANEY